MRWAVLYLLTLAGCASAPRPPDRSKPDPAAEAWYGETIRQLSAMNREAEGLLRAGKADAAAAIVTNGQPLASRLLAVSQPTLPAMEAASDLDDLYARMLLRNKQYGWARTFFQKNVVRWKNWKPRAPEVEKRWKQAASGVAECDRGLAE